MTKKIITFLLLVTPFLKATAQNGSTAGTTAVATASPKGIWIYLGNTLPKNLSYQIERKQKGTERYRVIGKTTVAASLTEMESLQQRWYPYFQKLDPLTGKEMAKMWDYLRRNSTTDSLLTSNLPLMHLLAGTAFLDTNAAMNTSYVYRVSLLTPDGKPVNVTETPPASMPAKTKLPEVHFSHLRYADGKLEMQWSVKDPLQLSHYNIYRSIFGKNDYRKIKIEKGIFSKDDSLMLIAIDTIGKRPSWYEYLLEPVDIYGNAGKLQGYCAGGSLKDYYAPPVSHFKATGTLNHHEIKLSWRYENKKYLDAITIMRSMIFDSGYTRIVTLSPADTTYTDIVPEGGENYYYYLELQSAESKPVATAKVAALYSAQSEKPEPPDEIDAQAINGGVKVYWKCESPYAHGFYVYRKENVEEGFVQVSGLVPYGARVYSFTDTSSNLQGGQVYQYAVRTVSDNNVFSGYSDTAEAAPRLTMKLSSPGHLRYRNNGAISLLWDDMREIDNNLLGYKVYRKSTDEKEFKRLPNDSLQAEKNFFIDSTVSPGSRYEYGVSAIDYFGNESPLTTITATIQENILPPPPGINVINSGNEITITWGQVVGDGISLVRIYRSAPGQQSKLIGTADPLLEEFTDKNVSKGKLYFYQLSIIDKDNKEGVLSEKISIRL